MSKHKIFALIWFYPIRPLISNFIFNCKNKTVAVRFCQSLQFIEKDLKIIFMKKKSNLHIAFDPARAERAPALGRHIDLISNITCQFFFQKVTPDHYCTWIAQKELTKGIKNEINRISSTPIPHLCFFWLWVYINRYSWSKVKATRSKVKV